MTGRLTALREALEHASLQLVGESRSVVLNQQLCRVLVLMNMDEDLPSRRKMCHFVIQQVAEHSVGETHVYFHHEWRRGVHNYVVTSVAHCRHININKLLNDLRKIDSFLSKRQCSGFCFRQIERRIDKL